MRPLRGALIGILAGLLAVSGCTTAPPEPGTPTELSIAGCAPRAALVPAEVNERCGATILALTSAQLVRYDPLTGEPVNDIAESIDTEDNQNYRVTLRPDYRFADGTPVLAHNFVDAWNRAASCHNHAANAAWMAVIDGFTELNRPGCTTGIMSGLRVVDDHTFTIRTVQPAGNLPVRLGHHAYGPLPDAYFHDPGAFRAQPFGAGPYAVTRLDYDRVELQRRTDYSGEQEPRPDLLQIRFHDSVAAAYAAVVAGEVDYTANVPAEALADDAWRAAVDGRALVREIGALQGLAFAPADTQLADPRRRQALSMAIDRGRITHELYRDTRHPATGWVPPIIDGSQAEQCGSACHHDPDAARELWQQAGGYAGQLTITVTGDGDAAAWAELICTGWRDTLGIDCAVAALPDLQALQQASGELTGVFEAPWTMGYPRVENFLRPRFAGSAASNWYGYADPEFDALLLAAGRARDAADANAIYLSAERRLPEGLPVAPLWYEAATAVWSPRLSNVKLSPFGRLDLGAVTVAS